MRKILLFTLCLIQAIEMNAQKRIINTLVTSYKFGFLTKNKDSVYYQKIFFDAFPSSFKSFNKVYGYENSSSKPMPLYNNAFEHINHFFNLKCIDKDSLTRKIINISIKGIWDADAVGYFQHGLIQYETANNKEFIRVLQTLPDKDVISVWSFYFDYENSYLRKKKYLKLLELVAPENSAMVSCVKSGYNNATKKWMSSH